MSVEKWGPVGERHVRLYICGHLIKFKNLGLIASTRACPVCGGDQPTVVTAARFDCVPSPELTWGDATLEDQSVLPSFDSHSLSCMTLETLQAFLSSGSAHPSQADLTGQTLRPRHSPPLMYDADEENSLGTCGTVPLAACFMVWRAEARGSRVGGGTVVLPPGGMMLLTGHGASFCGTTFTGAAFNAEGSASNTNTGIVCAGGDFSGTFQDCVFERCAVHVVHGATVTLRRCTFRRCSPGVLASGAAASATLQMCLFQRCPTGIIVEGGAALHAAACFIHSADVAAVVNNTGSHASFEDCVLRGHDLSGYGVAVCDGSARLSACGVLKARVGVHVRGQQPSVEVFGGFFDSCGTAAVLVHSARSTVRDVEVVNMHAQDKDDHPPALLLTAGDGESTLMQVERCAIHAKQGGAIGVFGNCHAAFMLCMLRSTNRTLSMHSPSRAVLLWCDVGSTEMACRVGGEGSMLRTHHSTLTGAGASCVVADGAVASLVDTVMRGDCADLTDGVVQCVDGDARMLRCAVKDCVTGVRMSGGRVASRDTHVSNVFPRVVYDHGDVLPPRPGVAYACLWGELTVAGGSIKSCTVGVWLGVENPVRDLGRGTPSATVRGVQFEGYGCGLDACPGSDAEVADCEFWGRDCPDAAARAAQALGPNGECEIEHQVGMKMERARGGVRGCRFTGNACDFVAVDCQGLIVRDCEFRQSHVPSMSNISLSSASAADIARCNEKVVNSIVLEGRGEVQDCKFVSTNVGIVARGSGAVLRRCTFTQAWKAVATMPNSDAKVLSCVATDCECGIVCGERSTVAMQDCEWEGSIIAMMVEGRGGVTTAKRVKARSPQYGLMAMPRGGPDTQIKCEDCEFGGDSAAVFVGGVGVRAVLRDCRMCDSRIGMHVIPSAFVRLRECQVFCCETGVLVAEDMWNMKSWCWACGVNNGRPDAVPAALASLTRRGDLGGPGRCYHRGGLGRVETEGGVVRNCERGVWVHSHGHISAKDLSVSVCGSAAAEFYYGRRELSSFSGCTYVACTARPLRMEEQAAALDSYEHEPIPGWTEMFWTSM
eukprot:jgi/Ulvmu1/6656/UM003_0294.1